MRALALITFLALAFFTHAIAQQQALQPGQQVRVTASRLGIQGQVGTL